MTFDIIKQPSQITSAWMTAVLQSGGAIDASTEVAEVQVKDLAGDGGLLSELYRVSITYAGGAGPASAIVKIPVDDETQRFTADVLGFYPRELAFYAQIAPNAPFGSPAIYGARLAEENTDFVLIMEDVGAMRTIDQIEGVSLEEAKNVLQSMAEFHAAWWQHADIPELTSTFLPIKNDVYIAALPGIFDGGWPNCQEFGAAQLTPEIIEFGDRFASLVPWLLDSMSEPATFVHGDWRSDNVFFGDDGAVTLIDFQISGFATGLYDVGYFIGQSMDSAVRAGHDEELVRHYLAALAANGVDYSFDEAWDKYRIVLDHCFIYGVTSFASWEHWQGRQRELMLSMLGRSVRAIMDNNALEVLPPA